MQGDTCPTEWYISIGHSVNLRMRLTSSDWLKVDFWILGPVAADTSYSEKLLFVGLRLCDVSAATGPCIQKLTFNQSEFLYRKRKFAEWPLDMYPSAGHSIALHNVTGVFNKLILFSLTLFGAVVFGLEGSEVL